MLTQMSQLSKSEDVVELNATKKEDGQVVDDRKIKETMDDNGPDIVAIAQIGVPVRFYKEACGARNELLASKR